VTFMVLRANSPWWDGLMADLPDDRRDVHFTPAYARLHETESSTPMLAVQVSGRQFVAMPFLVNRLGDACDVSSLPGFGGPIASGESEPMFSAFRSGWDDWLRNRGAVTEWCSLHPMFDQLQHSILGDRFPQHYGKQVVYLDLRRTDAELLARMRSDKRNKISKAIRHGVVREALRGDAVRPEHVQALHILYCETMVRAGAGRRWDRPREYFAAHFLDPRLDAALHLARIGGAIVAASLVLTAGPVAYYHHTGTANAAGSSGAIEALVLDACREARGRGCRFFHLGGGVTAAQNDSLFAFKAGFSESRAPVRAFFRVLDRESHARLCAESDARLGPLGGDQNFHPRYRRSA
jgi:hypothetical protein